MAGFHDISVDLVYVIFSHVQFDKRLLHDLALSCRLFREVAQRFFVRDVTITHSESCSRTKLFLRTILERPDLVGHVHRLELDLRREDVHWPDEQNNINRITGLLTNLREFRYSSRDYKIWHYEIKFPLRTAPKNPHNYIRKVEWHHNMTIKTLQECLRLPRIESVYLRELHGLPDDLKEHDQNIEPFSSLKELHLGSSMTLPANSIQHVLKMPRLLRSLRIDFRDAYRDGVKADEIAGLLEPVQEGLEELTITKPSGAQVSTGGPVDLSSFPSLKKVALPFRFLFRGDAPTSFEADAVLPPRLHELKLHFVSFTQETDYTTAHNNFVNLITWLNDMHVDGSHNSRYLRLPDLQDVVLEKTKFGGYPGDLHEDSVKDIIKIWKSFEDDGSGRLKIRYQLE